MPIVLARLEGDRLDENNAFILAKTPDRHIVEGDRIVWERGDGTLHDIYVEGISERGDVQVILRIDDNQGDRPRWVDFRLRFRDQTVAYPVIPDRAKAIIKASLAG